jgi:iodotyrosine deiodinase
MLPAEMSKPATLPLPARTTFTDEESIVRAGAFFDEVRTRRTVREFSNRPVPRRLIEAAIHAAGSAPSGANLQPWRFVAITDPTVKSRIREAAEAEEREFYAQRAPQDWLDLIAPLGTGAEKPFLEIAPWLIAIFSLRHVKLPDGRISKTYYPLESVGIATGILITALHQAGLATLTHTPSPMKFLNTILGRPREEKPFLLLVVGHPAGGARVPDIRRKSLNEIATFV